MDIELRRFALIGFGEAGSILGEDLVAAGRDVEVARTLQDVGLEPMMALATAARQDWLIEAMAARQFAFSGGSLSHGAPFSWRALADALDAGEQLPGRSSKGPTGDDQ